MHQNEWDKYVVPLEPEQLVPPVGQSTKRKHEDSCRAAECCSLCRVRKITHCAGFEL